MLTRVIQASVWTTVQAILVNAPMDPQVRVSHVFTQKSVIYNFNIISILYIILAILR